MRELTILHGEFYDSEVQKVYPGIRQLCIGVANVIRDCVSGKWAAVAHDTDEFEDRCAAVNDCIGKLEALYLCTRRIPPGVRRILGIRQKIKNAIEILRTFE